MTVSSAGHAYLAQKLDVRIATGENMYTRWDFLPFFEAGAIHVVQADASRCGGISEARRIFDLAGTYNLHAIPHTFSDALTIAANLHLVAASANSPMIEYDATYNPIQTALRRYGTSSFAMNFLVESKEGCPSR